MKNKQYIEHQRHIENEDEIKLQVLGFEFSLLSIDMYKYLQNKKEYVLSKQLLRSGTSIGANVHPIKLF